MADHPTTHAGTRKLSAWKEVQQHPAPHFEQALLFIPAQLLGLLKKLLAFVFLLSDSTDTPHNIYNCQQQNVLSSNTCN